MNPLLKDALLAQGEDAFLELTRQIGQLFDSIEFYLRRYRDGDQAEVVRCNELRIVLAELGSLPSQLAEVLKRWKNNEPRVLSRLGVERELLNEIWINIEIAFRFFEYHGIDTEPFNLAETHIAWTALQRLNKVMP